MQIGTTHESLDTIGDEGRVIWDYNLNTGLVVESRGDMEKMKTRVSYRVLRAGKVDARPQLSEAWPGRVLELGKDDLLAGAAAWKSNADLSAKLWALARGQAVWINAEVQDDTVTEGDGLRFRDSKGRELKAADIQKQPIPGSYLLRAGLDMAAVKKAGKPSFPAQEGFTLPVEVVDQDGPGRRAQRLSTAREGPGRAVPGCRAGSAAVEVGPKDERINRASPRDSSLQPAIRGLRKPPPSWWHHTLVVEMHRIPFRLPSPARCR